jgi:polysaccharide biosynthesis protein PslH
MNILILSPFLPYPLDQGGKIRIFNIIKNLSRSHRITLAAIVDDRHAADTGELHDLCEEVILVERPARLWPDRVAFFTRNLPYNVIRYRSAEMERALLELQGRRKFDLVQVEFSMMWQYARLFGDIPVLLDAHNIEYRNVQQIGARNQSLLWRMIYRLEEARLRKVEERAWNECSICFAVSDNEKNDIAKSCGDSAKVVTAANGVDPGRFVFRGREASAKKILFLGGMDYAPNLDAATYFLGEIFPEVRNRVPQAKLLLVGRELGKLGTLLQLPGVEAHESVQEVLPWFYEADVLAVPLRQGAGTRIKVLEAMAAGLPIVTTAKGCEGIEVESGKEVMVADTAQAFADALLQVMDEPELAGRLAAHARDLVLGGYTWSSAGRIMNDSYRTMLR